MKGSSSVGGRSADREGRHDAAEALAHLQGGVRRKLGRLGEAPDLCGAVEQLGEEIGQFLLKVSCKDMRGMPLDTEQQ